MLFPCASPSKIRDAEMDRRFVRKKCSRSIVSIRICFFAAVQFLIESNCFQGERLRNPACESLVDDDTDIHHRKVTRKILFVKSFHLSSRHVLRKSFFATTDLFEKSMDEEGRQAQP